MGATFSTLVNNVTSYVTGKKPKHSESDEEALHNPKNRKKLVVSTAKYIYQVLFMEGTNSDVTVCALGEEFKLHRVYLCQSPYFASMFGGSWLETTQKFINIDMVDPLITIDSLKVVLGSLYDGETVLKPLEIVPVLATATMFQLDELIEKCIEVMLETINHETSLDYYNAACQYGDKKFQKACFEWFLVNLMPYYFSRSHPSPELNTIPIALMAELVSHSDLFVIGNEYSIYVMLKYWIYVRLYPDSGEPPLTAVNEYFCSRQDKLPYLLTDEGKQFTQVFEGMRLQHLVSHELDIILRDNIIPRTWLHPVIMQQWRYLLRVHKDEDRGPREICDEVFLANSLRCGRVLTVNERHAWSWTGFNFGVHLLMITDGSTLSIKRNHSWHFEQLVSVQTFRYVAIRVTVVGLNKHTQTVCKTQSDILKIPLTIDEEIQIMSFDKDLEYPIIMSANIMYTSPDN